MANVRFYTDEHVSKAVSAGLRLHGIDVLTVPEAGMLGASDIEHLAFALANDRVIFTQDDDFLRLAAMGHPHAGVVYAPQSIPVGQILRGLLLVFHVLSAAQMSGHIKFI